MAEAFYKELDLPAKAPGTLKDKGCNVKSGKKNPVTFLDLPGEIRTKIYELSFPTTRVEITRAPARPEEGNKRRLTHKTLPLRGEDHQIDETADIPKSVPFGLVLASRQIYKETVCYLYSNTQFVFNSSKALKRFVLKPRCACQAYVHSMELNRVVNGEPRLTFFRKFKLKGDIQWERICRVISWSFPGLKELYFDVDIHDWPIKLRLDEDWAMPILCFSEKKKVDHAEVKLRMRMFDDDTVKTVAGKLERKLMTDKANIERDEKEFINVVKEATAAEAAAEGGVNGTYNP